MSALLSREREVQSHLTEALVHAGRGQAQIWHGYVAVAALLTGFYLFLPPLRGRPGLYGAVGLSAVVALAIGRRHARPEARRAWQLFTLGLALFWAGDLYARSLRPLLHATDAFPSPADALYFAMYPALLAGLLLLVRHRRRNVAAAKHTSEAIDAAIITLGLGLLSAFVLLSPYLRDTALPTAPKLLAVLYPLADIVLIAAATRLGGDAGRRQPAFLMLILGLAALLTVDFAYGVLRLHGTFHHQTMLDAGWLAFYMLLGAAALHPSMSELGQGDHGAQQKLTWFRLMLLAAASMIAPALGLIKEIGSSDPNVLVIIGSSIVLFALVIWRMAGLIKVREETAARERALADAGGMLVSASAPREIGHAVLEAARNLTDDAEVRLCVARQGAFEVFALDPLGAGGMADWYEEWSLLAALLERGSPRRLPRDAVAALRLPAGSGALYMFDLAVRGSQFAGSLIVAPEEELDEPTERALRHLVQQASLAVETSALNERMHRRSAEARMASLVQNSSDLITVLDESLTITYQSPAVLRVLGFSPDQLVGKPFAELLEVGDREHVLRRVRDGRAGDEPETIDCMLRRADGTVRHFELLRSDMRADSAVGGIVLNGRDVSERKAFEEQLTHQAFHDPVTHLANRALFNERVRHAVARSHREQGGLAIAFIDLDDFKTINDSLGHACGDQVLREVAERLALGVRAGDTVARFGGDEFAVLLEDAATPGDAAEAAERLLAALAQPLRIDGTELRIRASLGLSVAEPGAVIGGDELIRNADAAMYIAKAERQGGYRLFEPAMHERVQSRLELRGDLERALAQDEFELFYQPSVYLADGRAHGVEALLRWRHPDRGMVSPDQFVPFAEESGMIVAIGRWVLREGCKQGAQLRRRLGPSMPLQIAINLSVKQLFDPEIVGDVADALRDTGLEPSALTLEITESTMMVDTDVAVQRLDELKALGLKLAIDDFGTGYSSISYLSRFPVDYVKMDKSLLESGARTVMDGLVSAVVGLGATFNLKVIAEGIEWQDQWLALRDLGCDYGQGYLFAKPMPVEAATHYLEQNASGVRTPQR